MEKDFASQMETLKIYIELLRELIEMGNFHSATSVLSGIKNSTVVSEKTQLELRKSLLQLETKLERKTQKNFLQIFEKTEQSVPYIGKYLRQIQDVNNLYQNNEVFQFHFSTEMNHSDLSFCI